MPSLVVRLPFLVVNLPEDILRVLLLEWVVGTSFLQLVLVDNALACNRYLHQRFRKDIKRHAVGFSTKKFGFKSSAAAQWFVLRELEVRHLDLNFDSSSAIEILPRCPTFLSTLEQLCLIDVDHRRSVNAMLGERARYVLMDALQQSPNLSSFHVTFRSSEKLLFVPWTFVFQLQSLSSIEIHSKYGGAIHLATSFNSLPNLTTLSILGPDLTWPSLEALLLACPNLQILKLSGVDIESMPYETNWFATEPPRMTVVHTLQLANGLNKQLVGYLLHHCPKVRSLSVDAQVLWSFLGASRWQYLETLTLFTGDDSRDLEILTVSSSRPLRPYWNPVEDILHAPIEKSALMVQLLIVALRARQQTTTISFTINTEAFLDAMDLSMEEIEDMPVTDLTINSDTWSDIDMWKMMLSHPRLISLSLCGRCFRDVPDRSLADALQICTDKMKSLSVPSTLTAFSASRMEMISVMPSLVQLMPYLTSLVLKSCTLGKETLSVALCHLRQLSRFSALEYSVLRLVDDSDFNFEHMDFDGWSKVTIIMDGTLFTSWPKLRSLVWGLGLRLRRIVLRDVKASHPLRLIPDREFLSLNKHVEFE